MVHSICFWEEPVWESAISIIIDGDRVEQSNLNRQHYILPDVRRLKTEVLSERLKAIAPDADIEFTPIYMTKENLPMYALDCDVAVNALDFSISVPFLFDRYYVRKISRCSIPIILVGSVVCLSFAL